MRWREKKLWRGYCDIVVQGQFTKPQVAWFNILKNVTIFITFISISYFPIDFIFSYFSVIHFVQDPCLSVPAPCSNGGTCQVSTLDQTISCICSGGFSGQTCLVQTDPCQSLICPENSVCKVNPGVGPRCLCIPGYAGNCFISQSIPFLTM